MPAVLGRPVSNKPTTGMAGTSLRSRGSALIETTLSFSRY